MTLTLSDNARIDKIICCYYIRSFRLLNLYFCELHFELIKMNKLNIVFTGLMSLLFFSCTSETVDYTHPWVNDAVTSQPEELPEIIPPSIASAPLSTVSKETGRFVNEFSMKFYHANSKISKGNVCVSPFSVSSVLAMLANGDNGVAHDDILKIFGLEESDEGQNALNTYYQTIISNLPNIEENIKCNVTNTLWCDPKLYIIKKTFMETISDYFYAYKIGISPKGEFGKEAVNKFVYDNTNGDIKDFLSSPLYIDMAFLSTLYFQGGWSVGFDMERTLESAFTDIDHHQQMIDFMCDDMLVEYAYSDEGTQAIRLYYGEKKQFSLTLILPSSNINYDDFEEVLTDDTLKWINSNLEENILTLMVPKFEIEMNNPQTLEILKSIGLDKICNNESGTSFNLIAEENEFFLSSFVHAANFKIDENGTSGTAVTFGGISDSIGPSGEESNSFSIIEFNRPFIFYLQENCTETILFIGSVKTFS